MKKLGSELLVDRYFNHGNSISEEISRLQAITLIPNSAAIENSINNNSEIIEYRSFSLLYAEVN